MFPTYHFLLNMKNNILKSFLPFVLASFMVVTVVSTVLAVVTEPKYTPPTITSEKINCGAQINGPEGANIALCNILSSVNLIIFIVQLGSLAYFIWGVGRYIGAGGDEQKMKDSKKGIVLAIIAIAVIYGINVIVKYIGDYLGVTNTTPIKIPFFG